MLPLLLLLSVSAMLTTGTSSPEVSVTGGSIVGTVEQSAAGRQYLAYRGVPYAASPEGEWRFKPPRPVDGWTGVLSTNETAPYCVQTGRGQMMGQEDCLTLSVYTPQVSDSGSSTQLPVLIWLPGGAFVASGTGAYDPRLIMDRDVVLVIPQYRLGFLGFIYAFESAPGNYGMLDQTAALHWVQDNIAQFGGDPSRVTLGGDCAGGASALYHMIAPKSAGLFHGVMSLGGSPLNPWAKHPALRRTMLKFAMQLGCPKTMLGPMVDCFTAIPAHLLLNAQESLQQSSNVVVGNGHLAPAVQSFSVKGGMIQDAQFLTEEPLVPYAEGRFAQVPTLLMSSRNQGNYVVGTSLYEWMRKMSETEDESFKDKLVDRIVGDLGLYPKAREAAAIWEEYLPGLLGSPYEDKLAGIAELLGDALYNTGMLHVARHLNDKVPTWLLRFDFEDGPHYFDFSTEPEHAPPLPHGAGHLDPLNYFLPPKVEPFATEEQKRVSEIMLDIIDNFVNGRAPAAGEWGTTTDAGLECAVISTQGTLEQDTFLPEGRLKVAEMIFQQHHMTALNNIGTPRPRETRDEL